MEAATVRQLLLAGAALWNQESRQWVLERLNHRKNMPSWCRWLFRAMEENDGAKVKEWIKQYGGVECVGKRVLEDIAQREGGTYLQENVVGLVASIQWDQATTAQEKVKLLKQLVAREEAALEPPKTEKPP